MPLLPMQQGFLWRSLAHDSDACELTLHCTLHCTLGGQINLGLLEQAWQLVVNSHQTLRSSVHWQNLSVPVQVVHKQVSATVNIVTAVSPQNAQPERLHLENAPTHQLTLTSTSADRCDVEWLLSHVLLDGWSCSLVINDWLRYYSALINGNTVDAKSSIALKTYSQWIRQQDQRALVDFWNQAIPATVPLATPLPYLDSVPMHSKATAFATITHTVDEDMTGKLSSACKQAGVSINSALQATLGLVLKPAISADDLVFSSTVSGRQVDVPGIDKLVGMLINVMPVRVAFNSECSVREWLIEHQARFFASLPYAHISLSDVIDARAGGKNLTATQAEHPVNCLLVVENQAIPASSKELSVTDYHSGIVSEMDMTVLVVPADCLSIEIRYRQDLLCDSAVEDLLERFTQLLVSLPQIMEQPFSVTAHCQSALSVSRLGPVNSQNSTDEQPGARTSGEHERYTHLTPKPLVEKQLHTLWQQVFGFPVDEDTAFFDLGGNSLQAVRLFALIEKHMNCRLPATALFAAPTINKLAAFIASSESSEPSGHVVGINTDGTRCPLFVPFEQSDMLMYRHLFDALGADQPVYGLQTSQTPLSDECEIDALVQAMTTLQPQGPYMLAGLSGSGLSAWLIAQKLESMGHKVAMLCLLDSYGPDYPRLPSPWATLARVSKQLLVDGATFGRQQLTKRVATRMGGRVAKRVDTRAGIREASVMAPKPASHSKSDSQDQSVFAKRMNEDRHSALAFTKTVTATRSWHERFALVSSVRIASVSLRSFNMKMELLLLVQGLLLQYCQRTSTNAMDTLSLTQIEPRDAGMSALQVFLKRYQRMYSELKPYRGKIVYIAASQRQAVCLDDQSFGWRSLMSAHADIHHTPGTHLNMLKPPNVAAMADILSTEMKQAFDDCQKTALSSSVHDFPATK